jgi:hypothetical protein
MPKLTQWAEDNIPEGLSIFGLGLILSNPPLSINPKTHHHSKTSKP